MYAIMVPHKAWAAGDTLCALVKFSPLSKGIRITGITTSLHEHLKTFGRSGATHDENRVACSVKHEIHNGRAVSVPYFSAASSLRWTQQHSHSPFSTNLSTPSVSDDARSPLLSEPFNPSTAATSNSGRTPLDTPLDIAPSPRNTSGDGSSLTLTSSASNLAGNSSSATIAAACFTGDNNSFDIGEQEIVTTLELPLPGTLTPTHAVEPVHLSHRLRWNILLSNPDGHVSELRCSLPIHILDSSSLEDARAATRVTRRLLFGLEIAQDDGDEIQLPSYPSHVMDRVPDDEEQAAAALATMGGSQNGTPSGLDWVNMQLMSDGQSSRPTSPPDSRLASRTSSRAPSPERRDRERGHHGFFSSLKPFTKVTSSFSNHSRQSAQSHMHGDNNSHATDESSLSSLSLTLSPSHGSATLSGSFPPTPDRSQPGTPPLSYPTIQNGTPQRRPISTSASASRTSSPRNTVITLPGTDTTSIDNEVAALSRVPHYAIASRGFLGGITPISSLRGLPSYEEASRPSRTTAASPVSTVVDSLPSSHSLGRQLPALMPIQSTREMSRRSAAERSFSEGDLAARFANASQRR